MMNAEQVEQVFLEHFARQGYRIVPGSKLLDESIPMAFVMSAGLVQAERAAEQEGISEQGHLSLVQNCFRYFDLDGIGKDDLHLSFFRMAGAFTFGPPEPRARITDLWDLLVMEYGLPPDRLWATYFCGDIVAGRAFPADEEARAAWLAVGLPAKRVLGLDGTTNFWRQSQRILKMGVEHAAKCGPNTELFYDRGADLACGPACRPGCACGRFVEFVNMLFLTWSIDETDGRPAPLKRPFIETVIGVERLAMLLQLAPNVFEIDAIRPLLLLARAAERRKRAPRQRRQELEHRLADHLRAAFYLVADGAPLPHGSGARGYLMRKLIRRMVACLKVLEIPEHAFLTAAMEVLPAAYFPEPYDLLSVRQAVVTYILDESVNFEHSIGSAQRRLDRDLARLAKPGWISGQEVLRIEKEKGIPLDLIQNWLRDRHVRYSPAAYRAASTKWRLQSMQAQRNRSSGSATEGSDDER